MANNKEWMLPYQQVADYLKSKGCRFLHTTLQEGYIVSHIEEWYQVKEKVYYIIHVYRNGKAVLFKEFDAQLIISENKM